MLIINALICAALFLQNVSRAQITFTEHKVFSASHISSIPDIPDDAVSVKIRKLRMDRIPANSFAHLTSCTEMKIWNSTVNVIDNGAFNGLDSLRELKLWSNAIHTIESGAFHGLNNVELFYFWYNKIDVIEPRAFSGFNKLTDLEIWRNSIGTINTTAFTGMRNLTKLIILENRIGRLDYLAFSGLDSLKTIKIEKNFIHTIGTWAFYGLDGLVELRLFNNSILIVEEGGLHLSGNSSTTLIQYLNSYGAKDPKAREAPSGDNIEDLEIPPTLPPRIESPREGLVQPLESSSGESIDSEKPTHPPRIVNSLDAEVEPAESNSLPVVIAGSLVGIVAIGTVVVVLYLKRKGKMHCLTFHSMKKKPDQSSNYYSEVRNRYTNAGTNPLLLRHNPTRTDNPRPYLSIISSEYPYETIGHYGNEYEKPAAIHHVAAPYESLNV